MYRWCTIFAQKLLLEQLRRRTSFTRPPRLSLDSGGSDEVVGGWQVDNVVEGWRVEGDAEEEPNTTADESGLTEGRGCLEAEGVTVHETK